MSRADLCTSRKEIDGQCRLPYHRRSERTGVEDEDRDITKCGTCRWASHRKRRCSVCCGCRYEQCNSEYAERHAAQGLPNGLGRRQLFHGEIPLPLKDGPALLKQKQQIASVNMIFCNSIDARPFCLQPAGAYSTMMVGSSRALAARRVAGLLGASVLIQTH